MYPISVPTTRYHLKSYNFYLIEQSGSFTLLDTGMDIPECRDALLQILAENGLSLRHVERVVLTHCHDDHVGLVNWLVRETGVPVYAHEAAIPRLRKSKAYRALFLDFYKKMYQEMGCGELAAKHLEMMANGTLDYGLYTVDGDIIPVREGDRIGHFSVIETPGHSPDHIALYDENRQWLFSGDHLIQHISSNATVEPDMEGNRLFALIHYVSSLDKCSGLQVELAFPGHGSWIRDCRGLIAKRLMRIGEKCDVLVQCIRGGLSTADRIARACYGVQYERQFPLVMSEVIGHLDYLEMNHRVRKERQDGVWHYFSCERV